MKALTVRAVLQCDHDGKVTLQNRQSWVRVQAQPLLVDDDPEGRAIVACPNFGPLIKPCVTTLAVRAGYSTFVRIGKRSVCLDSIEGFTDGTPPGIVTYTVRQAGQSLIRMLA